MKSRIFANLCLSLLLLFAQHVALADAFSHVRHTISDQTTDQTTQCALEEGSSPDDGDGDTGNHVALDDLNGLVSAFVFSVLTNSPQSQSQSISGDLFATLSQYYSTRAPPTL